MPEWVNRRCLRRFTVCLAFFALRCIFYIPLVLICTYFVGLIVLRNWSHPELIVRIDYEWPTLVEFPSITICAPVIVAPSRLAELYPDFNKSYHEYLAIKDPKQAQLTEEVRLDMFRRFESLALNRYTVYELINSVGVQLKDLVRQCAFHPITFRNRDLALTINKYLSIACENYKAVLPTIYQSRKCFTYYSNLVDSRDDWMKFLPNTTTFESGTPDIDIMWKELLRGNENYIKLINDSFNHMSVDFNPRIEVTLKMNDDVFGYIPNHTIVVTVHPPTVLPNKQDFARLTLQPDIYYDVAITRRMVDWSALPNCLNRYRHIGPKNWTRDQFLNFCIQTLSFNRVDNCINPYAMVNLLDMELESAKALHVCGYDKTDFLAYLNAKYRCQMQPECQEIFYVVSGVVQELPTHRCHLGVNHRPNRYCSSTVAVRFASRAFMNVTYLPPSTGEEIFGIIGGHFGIWLGLSLYTILNCIITGIFYRLRLVFHYLATIPINFRWRMF